MIVFEFDEGFWRLIVIFIWDCDNDDFFNSIVLVDCFFDYVGINVVVGV